jgi:hypothetical protein
MKKGATYESVAGRWRRTIVWKAREIVVHTTVPQRRKFREKETRQEAGAKAKKALWDSAKADTFVVRNDGSHYRPNIQVLIDHYTRQRTGPATVIRRVRQGSDVNSGVFC